MPNIIYPTSRVPVTLTPPSPCGWQNVTWRGKEEPYEPPALVIDPWTCEREVIYYTTRCTTCGHEKVSVYGGPCQMCGGWRVRFKKVEG